MMLQRGGDMEEQKRDHHIADHSCIREILCSTACWSAKPCSPGRCGISNWPNQIVGMPSGEEEANAQPLNGNADDQHVKQSVRGMCREALPTRHVLGQRRHSWDEAP